MIWPFGKRKPTVKTIGQMPTTRDQVRAELAASRAQIVAMTSWSWNGGMPAAGWRGDKFSGALTYPSLWRLDHYELRRRGRIAYWDSVQARSLVGRLDDNVVNTGLTLEATPAWEIIDVPGNVGLDERQRHVRDVEIRFHLWARSKEPDATGRMTLAQITGLVFHTRIVDGEVFAIFRYSQDQKRMNPLSIQLINADDTQSPAKPQSETRIEDGIEMDAVGKELAYHVLDHKTGKTVRIPAVGPKSERVFMLHIGTPATVGQVRCISELAPIVHELQKITDYTVAEIESAIINATIAAWVEPSEAADASMLFGGVQDRGTSSEQTEAGDTRNTPPSRGYIEQPGLMIQNLKAGEKLQSYDTKRPNAGYEVFVNAVKKSLSASLGIPIGVLDMAFSSNYSASRGELLLFWNRVRRLRAELASDFLDLVYYSWLNEERRARRIDLPGWSVPVIRAAWLNCDWVGISPPAIDPLKEANAAKTRVSEGHSTRTYESRQYNGSEFSENAERLEDENQKLAQANASLQPAPMEPMLPEDREDE